MSGGRVDVVAGRRPALDPSQGEEPAQGQHPAAGRVLQVDVEAVVRATATVGSLADRTVLDLLGCRRIGAYRGPDHVRWFGPLGGLKRAKLLSAL